MKSQAQEIKRSFSIILAEAVTLAEIHKRLGVEGIHLLQCDIKAYPIKRMDSVCSPNLTELGIEGYSEHTVWRSVHLRAMMGDLREHRDIRAFRSINAGCVIFSISQGRRYWQPYKLFLDIGYLMVGPSQVVTTFTNSHGTTYWNGTFDNVSVHKNADNPCADLCALQVISGDVNAEEGDEP